MIYLVGVCVAAKIISRKLHRLNEQFAKTTQTDVVHLSVTQDEPVAVAKVVR